MSDIYGYPEEFDYALSLDLEYLDEPDTKPVLLGDYVHGGYDSYGVLDRIIKLQENTANVLLLLPAAMNPCALTVFIQSEQTGFQKITTMMTRMTVTYHGWELSLFTTQRVMSYLSMPAQTGHFYKDLKIIAGHTGTASISGNQYFHDIYYDGQSHYYIDGGGKTTIEEILRLSDDEIMELIEYISSFSKYECLTIYGKKYILVHSVPHDFKEEKSLDEYDINKLLWGRPFYTKRYFRDENTFLVTGHTPTRCIRSDGRYEIFRGCGSLLSALT